MIEINIITIFIGIFLFYLHVRRIILAGYGILGCFPFLPVL